MVISRHSRYLRRLKPVIRWHDRPKAAPVPFPVSADRTEECEITHLWCIMIYVRTHSSGPLNYHNNIRSSRDYFLWNRHQKFVTPNRMYYSKTCGKSIVVCTAVASLATMLYTIVNIDEGEGLDFNRTLVITKEKRFPRRFYLLQGLEQSITSVNSGGIKRS